MESYEYHQPVMLHEVDNHLITNIKGTYVDSTLGGGGHSSYLLEKYPEIKIIATDWDEAAINAASKKIEKFKDRITIVRENFCNLKVVLQSLNVTAVNGILLDLGVSSKQLDDLDRGFSFRSDVLDMRMDQRLSEKAEDLINTLDEKSLADIIFQFGEERLSRPISKIIVEEREKNRIISGQALALIIEKVKWRHGKIHPATKVFQALRIAVNKELENLTMYLNDLPSCLLPGAHAVIMSYHSLEDRMIKNNFRQLAHENIYKLINKKVIIASEEEMKLNHRARSAKLRVAEKI